MNSGANHVPYRIRIGISRCLLGDRVRHDGGHKRDSYITEVLVRYFELVPLCPELEAGMGVPRESVNLVKTSAGIQLKGVQSSIDWTEPMQQFCTSAIEQLKKAKIYGFIFKKDSPSCGVAGVKIYDEQGAVREVGSGMFAHAFCKTFPALPVEEEGHLQDPLIRDNFLERIFCYHRLSRLIGSNPKTADLMEFHSRHKMTILSHSNHAYRSLGRFVAQSGQFVTETLLEDYTRRFMQALKIPATRSKHVNVLQHLAGYLKKQLKAAEKRELAGCIEQYRLERVALIVPITLLKHHFQRHPNEWIEKQTYLNRHPVFEA